MTQFKTTFYFCMLNAFIEPGKTYSQITNLADLELSKIITHEKLLKMVKIGRRTH